MMNQEEAHYTVILLFPGFGSERENAEAIVESAIDWLNTNKDEPGFRFAYPVFAHLESVQNADEARDRIEEDANVAIVIMHDLDDEERNDLVRYCKSRNIGACYTVDVPRQTGPRKEPFKLVLRARKSEDEVSAHTLVAGTLIDPVDEEDEDTGVRVGDVVAMLALGVMQHHWHAREK